MNEELLRLIEQLKGQSSGGQRSFSTPTPDSATPDQLNRMRDEYARWAWGTGIANQALGSSPSFIGHSEREFSPTQTVGGYGPQFAAKVDQMLYPEMQGKRRLTFGQGGPGTNEYQGPAPANTLDNLFAAGLGTENENPNWLDQVFKQAGGQYGQEAIEYLLRKMGRG